MCGEIERVQWRWIHSAFVCDQIMSFYFVQLKGTHPGFGGWSFSVGRHTTSNNHQPCVQSTADCARVQSARTDIVHTENENTWQQQSRSFSIRNEHDPVKIHVSLWLVNNHVFYIIIQLNISFCRFLSHCISLTVSFSMPYIQTTIHT